MDLGLTQEELREAVVAKAAKELIDRERGLEEEIVGRAEKELQEMTRKAIDEAVERIAGVALDPLIEGRIDEIVLAQTNRYGEKAGEDLTFREYLAARAEAYMTEPVDMDGHSKKDSRFSSHSRNQARVAFMIDKHLQFSIERAMKDALSVANSAIVKGLEATVKMKLEEIVRGIKTTVQMPR